MLTKVQVYTAQGSDTIMLELPLGNDLLDANPLQIRNIQGLGPVKADIVTTKYGSIGGEFFSGSSVGKRNIVMTIGLNPNWSDQSMASLRTLIYDYFIPSQFVELDFFSTHLPSVAIEGYVESCEPNIFSKDPEVQLSIICPNPDFVSNIISQLDNQVVDADGSTPVLIEYAGTMPTGFNIIIANSVARPSYTGTFQVWKTNAVADSLYFTGTVDATKTIHVDTRQGSKNVNQIAAGVPTNLLSTVTDISTWPQLARGENLLAVVATLAGQLWSISYRERFGGI